MTGQFEMVATLSIGKKTEKFTPYEEKSYDSGWMNRALKFSATNGTNRHNLEIRGGCKKDGSSEVLTFSKNTTEKDGKKSHDKLTIKWKDRLRKDIITEVAEFRKYVLDLEEPGRRRTLEELVKKFEEGNVTDEDVQSTGIDTIESAKEALEKSLLKRHEYLTTWDFADAMNKLLNKEEYKKFKFIVRGDIETTENNGKFYTRYLPTRVYRAADNAETLATANITMYFNNKAIDDGSLTDTFKYYINGFVFNYDSGRKCNIPTPVMVSLPFGDDEKSKKMTELLLKNFTIGKVDGKLWKELGVKVNLLNGAEVKDVAMEDLSENEIALLDAGLVSMNDLVREHGGKVYGDRIQEWQVVGFARGWMSGAKATKYTDDDFVIPEQVEDEEKEETLFDDEEEI